MQYYYQIPPRNRTTMPRYFNDNNMPLLCFVVKHLFYIPPVLVVWRRTTSQTGAFDIVTGAIHKGQRLSSGERAGIVFIASFSLRFFFFY
jgi:hypothetical protein